MHRTGSLNYHLYCNIIIRFIWTFRNHFIVFVVIRFESIRCRFFFSLFQHPFLAGSHEVGNILFCVISSLCLMPFEFMYCIFDAARLIHVNAWNALWERKFIRNCIDLWIPNKRRNDSLEWMKEEKKRWQSNGNFGIFNVSLNITEHRMMKICNTDHPSLSARYLVRIVRGFFVQFHLTHPTHVTFFALNHLSQWQRQQQDYKLWAFKKTNDLTFFFFFGKSGNCSFQESDIQSIKR